jgi:hypothetical protein
VPVRQLTAAIHARGHDLEPLGVDARAVGQESVSNDHSAGRAQICNASLGIAFCDCEAPILLRNRTQEQGIVEVVDVRLVARFYSRQGR